MVTLGGGQASEAPAVLCVVGTGVLLAAGSGFGTSVSDPATFEVAQPMARRFGWEARVCLLKYGMPVTDRRGPR